MLTEYIGVNIFLSHLEMFGEAKTKSCCVQKSSGTDDLVFKIEKKSSEKTGTAISVRKNVILLSALEYAILIQCEIT